MVVEWIQELWAVPQQLLVHPRLALIAVWHQVGKIWALHQLQLGFLRVRKAPAQPPLRSMRMDLAAVQVNQAT